MRILALCLILAILTGCDQSGQHNQLSQTSDSTQAPSTSSTTIPLIASPAVTSQAMSSQSPIISDASVEEIADQSFNVELESWGKVRFVSAKVVNADGHKDLLLCLKDASGNTLYTFPQPRLVATWNFESVKAISFKDVDGDGKQDVILLADYVTGKNPVGSATIIAPSIFIQKDKSFLSDFDKDNRLNSSGKITTVSDVVTFLKAKADATKTITDSENNMTLEEVNRNLCSKVLATNMSEDEIINTYNNEYSKRKLDGSEYGQDKMFYYIGECFQQETNKLIESRSNLKAQADAIYKTVTQAISDLSRIDYIRNSGGTMWSHDGHRTIGLYGYRMNAYVKMKLNEPASAPQKYDVLAKKLDSYLEELKDQGVKGLVDLQDAQKVKEAQGKFDSEFPNLKITIQKFEELTSDKDNACIYLLQLLVDRLGASIDEAKSQR